MKTSSEKVSELADAQSQRQLRTERLAERVGERARDHYEFPRWERRVVSRVVLENGVLAGLRSLSIEEEEDLSEFAERQESPRRPTRRKSVKKQEPVKQEPVEQQPVEQEPSEQEPVEQEPLKMSTAEPAHGIVADAVKVPNVMVTAATGYPLIKTF